MPGTSWKGDRSQQMQMASLFKKYILFHFFLLLLLLRFLCNSHRHLPSTIHPRRINRTSHHSPTIRIFTNTKLLCYCMFSSFQSYVKNTNVYLFVFFFQLKFIEGSFVVVVIVIVCMLLCCCWFFSACFMLVVCAIQVPYCYFIDNISPEASFRFFFSSSFFLFSSAMMVVYVVCAVAVVVG